MTKEKLIDKLRDFTLLEFVERVELEIIVAKMFGIPVMKMLIAVHDSILERENSYAYRIERTTDRIMKQLDPSYMPSK